MKITDKMSNLYEKVKSNPLTAAFVGIGATSAALSLTGDTEHLETSINAGLRAVMINSNEIINTGLVPINFLYESIVESGAGFDMIKNDGLAGGLGALSLMIGEAEIKYKKKTTEEKHGLGKGVLILPVAAFLTIAYLLTNNESSTSHQTPPSPDKIPDNPGLIPTEAATPETYPTDTVEATENPTEIQPTPTQDTTELPWYYGKTNYEETTVHTLFGNDLNGVKAPMSQPGNYNVFYTDSPDLALTHQEYPNFDLYSELQPDQARALEDQYGSIVSLTMEQVDTDGDGALDKVAVRYEGSKGVGEFTMDYGKPTSKSVGGVLSEMIVAKL